MSVAGKDAGGETVETVHGVTERTYVLTTDPSVAEIVTLCVDGTFVVVIAKRALDAPPATVADGGTTAEKSLLRRDTTSPPVGAGPVREMVPVAPDPPITVEGFTESAESEGALTLRVAVFVVPFTVPEIVATTSAGVGDVVTVNVPVVAPAETVAVAGTAAATLSLVSAIANPPTGAADVIVMVPEEGVPPITAAGLRDTVDRIGGLIVRVGVFVTAPAVAVMVVVVEAPTATVVTENVAVDDAAGTVTEAGTVAAALSDDRVTTKPPACAGAESVTVPVDEAPPVNEVGLRVTEESTSATGLIVSVAGFVTAAAEAVIVAVVMAPTNVVETLNVAVVAPWATVTLAGTVAATLSLVRFTTKPPEGAMLEMVTVPVDDVPPLTEAGASARDERSGGLTVRDAG